MRYATNTCSREQMLIRSCLESAPGRRKLGAVSSHGGGERNGNTQLHHLKQKALYGAMQQAPPSFHKRLCGAANLAAELAWDTDAPAVMFPPLFEAMARSIYDPVCGGSSPAEADVRSRLLQELDSEVESPREQAEEPAWPYRVSRVRRFIASGIALALGAAGLVGCLFELLR